MGGTLAAPLVPLLPRPLEQLVPLPQHPNQALVLLAVLRMLPQDQPPAPAVHHRLSQLQGQQAGRRLALRAAAATPPLQAQGGGQVRSSRAGLRSQVGLRCLHPSLCQLRWSS